MGLLSDHEVYQLRSALQDAVIKCSERCLYQSAKWCVSPPPKQPVRSSHR